MKTTMTILAVALLAGCTPAPTLPIEPPPNFLMMCEGDEACALRMEYNDKMARAEQAAIANELRRAAIARGFQRMARAFGTMANAGRSGGSGVTTTTCNKFGNTVRCTSH